MRNMFNWFKVGDLVMLHSFSLRAPLGPGLIIEFNTKDSHLKFYEVSDRTFIETSFKPSTVALVLWPDNTMTWEHYRFLANYDVH